MISDDANAISQKECAVSFSFFEYTCHLHIFYKGGASFKERCLLPFYRHKYLKKTTAIGHPLAQLSISFISLFLPENTHSLVYFNSNFLNIDFLQNILISLRI